MCRDINKAGCECNPLLSDRCIGHETWNNTAWISDDVDIENEEDCVHEYTGGIWETPVCTITLINLVVKEIKNDNVTSQAKYTRMQK